MSPTTDTELADHTRAFIVRLLGYLKPHNLPLTPEAQAAFIQSTLYTAQELHDSEPFLRAQVVAAVAKHRHIK